jgi:hypothetical protein
MQYRLVKRGNRRLPALPAGAVKGGIISVPFAQQASSPQRGAMLMIFHRIAKNEVKKPKCIVLENYVLIFIL